MLLGASFCQDRVLVWYLATRRSSGASSIAPGSDLLLLTLRVGSQSVESQSSQMSDSLPPFRQIPHSWQHVALCLIFKSLGLS
uniref:Uncharacterized protein n=2 Tax=Rhinopithecus TaxID=542827 RepID=A0A2K6M7J2_RHIBE